MQADLHVTVSRFERMRAAFIVCVLFSSIVVLYVVVSDVVNDRHGYMYMYMYMPNPVSSKNVTLNSNVHVRSNNQPKTIIFWTKYYGHTWRDNHLSKCGKHKCYSTSKRSLLPYADAVVFHGFDNFEIKEALSVPRLTHQYWIYYNKEASLRSTIQNITQYEPVFNWTMTYKLDSDIIYSYSRVLPGKYLRGFDSKRNYLKRRTKTAFAIISNCFKPRLDYIHELKKYIDIDLYGKCPGHKPFCRRCWKIAKKYKFYLSFENSLCTDYITEKTYTNAFTHELVPVIMSGANLSNPLLIPQGSYVDARSYSSAKALATYLMEVSNNSTLYNNFFKWRAEWKIVNQWDYKGLECSICEKLYESNEVKIYNNIYSWFNRSKECVDWSVVQTE